MIPTNDFQPEIPDPKVKKVLPASTLEIQLAASIVDRLIKQNGGRDAADAFWDDDTFDALDDGGEYLHPELRDRPLALVAAAFFSLCFSVLLVLLLLAPRQDCFFFRWYPETRLLALMAAPFLVILWPLLLVIWVMRSGLFPDDPDFF